MKLGEWLLVLFVGLKIGGAVDWMSWWLVTAPVTVPLAMIVLGKSLSAAAWYFMTPQERAVYKLELLLKRAPLDTCRAFQYTPSHRDQRHRSDPVGSAGSGS